ncbi:MAG: hypothetical protein K2N29_00440 [Ruminiclostridium sp.]|nr:hypothetical protein [Ruminiclostridium sp.]
MEFGTSALFEKNCLYHGSIFADLKILKAVSFLHGTDKKVVYLTDNIPYALFYIWDGDHNNYDRKFVTGWIENKIANYEEVFPNQLELFYKGVSGYLYCIEKKGISSVNERKDMYYSETDIFIDRSFYVPDIYEELMKYEAAGKFKLLRFHEQSEKRQNELIDKYAHLIIKSDFFHNDEAKLKFYRKYLTAAWERADFIYNKK